jgi:RNA polymerase sigma-70 factor (ECF subfamily)
MGGFEKLYRQHVDAVFRYSLHCVGRREIAEEITGDAFLALYRNLDRIEEGQLPAWLFTVAKNRATDYWRHCAVEERYASAAAAEAGDCASAPMPDWLFESKALKPIHRVCLVLRYVYGMGRAEIAQQTGLSDNQIKSCLQYARQLLRKQLGLRSE